MTDLGILDDLEAEETSLDLLVAPLDTTAWDTPTPAAGWAVRDQIAHLALSEDLAGLAASDPDAFAVRLESLLADISRVDTEAKAQAAAMSPSQLLGWWRASRSLTVAALRKHGPKDRIPWVAQAMSTVSFATARLMETWAHGQDIVDALGLQREPTERLRHVAHIGVGTRPFSYLVRGRLVPDVPVRVELTAPDGDVWTWGPEDATDRITGTAEDFCLVVTQRRHRDDTNLVVEGPAATEWIEIAQAFAGPPTEGRPPGQFT